MAISLSNHEDRIKKLENSSTSKQPSWITLYSGHWAHIRACYIWIPKVASRLWIIINGNGNPGDIHYNQTGYIGNVITSGYIDLKCPSLETRLVYLGEVNNCYKYELQNVNSSGDNCYNIMAELKLYYNFSYNIYSLANFISFHFFKCLINSFKGGVKEIWQLV